MTGGPLVRPGDTCWRIEPARRLALLIDNQAYFAALWAALRRARRSVLLLGWAFDPRARLDVADAATAAPDRIGDALRELAAWRPELDIRVLIWDTALPISATRAFFPQRARVVRRRGGLPPR
jgi:phosphatidylserine/phosphatidylglycerophosphate/cardiolipin synthase-like enzyme